MIYVIEDDKGWEDYYKRILGKYPMRFFRDGIAAISGMDEEVPSLVFLDVLLTGPTGFAILNEMRSYPELMNVPVAVVTSIQLDGELAEKYGVVAVLDKGEMKPSDLLDLARKYA